MAEKLFDVYSIIGILISILAVLFNIYTSPKEIPLQYIFIILISIGILVIIMILLNKFSIIDKKLKKVGDNEGKIKALNKRFKRLRGLNDIRLDIRELQKRF